MKLSSSLEGAKEAPKVAFVHRICAFASRKHLSLESGLTLGEKPAKKGSRVDPLGCASLFHKKAQDGKRIQALSTVSIFF